MKPWRLFPTAVVLLAAPLAAGTYSDWAAGEFDSGELADQAISSPEADPDRDGVINLLEYAFDSDPLFADAVDISPRVESGAIVFEFKRDTAKNDLTVTVETSKDMRVWRAVSSQLLSVRKGVEKRKVTLASEGAGFLRLRVVRTPTGS